MLVVIAVLLGLILFAIAAPDLFAFVVALAYWLVIQVTLWGLILAGLALVAVAIAALV